MRRRRPAKKRARPGRYVFEERFDAPAVIAAARERAERWAPLARAQSVRGDLVVLAGVRDGKATVRMATRLEAAAATPDRDFRRQLRTPTPSRVGPRPRPSARSVGSASRSGTRTVPSVRSRTSWGSSRARSRG